MRALEDLRSRRGTPSELRHGRFAALGPDSLAYRAPRNRWIAFSVLIILFAAAAVAMLAVMLSTVQIRPGEELLVAILALVLGAFSVLLALVVLRTAVHVLAGRPTIAVDRQGLHHWRQGLIRWAEMGKIETRRSEYEGNVLVIRRQPRPGERTWFGRPAKTELSEHLLEISFPELVLVMAQYSAADRHGTPTSPPRPERGWAPLAADAPQILVSAEPIEIDDEAPEEQVLEDEPTPLPADDSPMGVHVLGGVLDPSARVGLHQVNLQPLLDDRPSVIGYLLPHDLRGEATYMAIETLLGANPTALANEPRERLARLLRTYGPGVLGTFLLLLAGIAWRSCS